MKIEVGRHYLQISRLEDLIRDSIPDDLGMLSGECGEKIWAVRYAFIGAIRFAQSRFCSLRDDLALWRSQVSSGERDFSIEDEEEFKRALSTMISCARLLNEKYETYRQKGIILHRPNIIGMVLGRIREIEKTLREWQSPEWESINTRTVRWDREQSEYLLDRLGAHE